MYQRAQHTAKHTCQAACEQEQVIAGRRRTQGSGYDKGGKNPQHHTPPVKAVYHHRGKKRSHRRHEGIGGYQQTELHRSQIESAHQHGCQRHDNHHIENVAELYARQAAQQAFFLNRVKCDDLGHMGLSGNKGASRAKSREDRHRAHYIVASTSSTAWLIWGPTSRSNLFQS